MLNSAPSGSIGVATPKGWMTSELCPKFLEHLVHHKRPSKITPKLIILDNQESHLSYEAIKYASENRMQLLNPPLLWENATSEC